MTGCVRAYLERSLEISRLRELRAQVEIKNLNSDLREMIHGMIQVIEFDKDDVYIEMAFKDPEIYLQVMSAYYWLHDSEVTPPSFSMREKLVSLGVYNS